MQTVTVSPKYQVVIPKAIREALHLRPGQKMHVMEYDGRIELIPEKDIKDLRGFLKGKNTEFMREEDGACEFNATLWTQNLDFINIRGVKYFSKK